jgi:Glucosyltransferase 24/Thioredoxin-like domain/UDP-glucose:Glycoprotein Glucosyltransferase
MASLIQTCIIFSVVFQILADSPSLTVRDFAKPVEIATWAPWPSYPFSPILETAEFLADEDPTGSLFWRYFNAIGTSAVEKLSTDLDEISISNYAFREAGKLVSGLAFDVLQSAVQFRSYSPAIESHRQLSIVSSGHVSCNQPGTHVLAWAETYSGEVACNLDQLVKLIAMVETGLIRTVSKENVFVGDHLFTASSASVVAASAQKSLITLYCVLGSSECHEFHSKLVEAAEEGKIRYLFRHFPGHSVISNKTWLAGFGVGIDLKSTEYKFIDDRKSDSSSADEKNSEESLSSVLANDFTLKEILRNLDASFPLNVLSDPITNASELSSVGLQAVSWIMNSAKNQKLDVNTDPLDRLVMLTGNFPSMVKYLSKLSFPESIRKEAILNAPPPTMSQALLMEKPPSLMTVNGISVEPSSPQFNLFALFNVLRSEADVMSQLDTLPLSITNKRKIQALAISGSPEHSFASNLAGETSTQTSSTTRVDMLIEPSEYINLTASKLDFKPKPHPIIVYLNDIEKDKQYSAWPSALQVLLQPAWQLPQLRRNLFNVVNFGDFSSLKNKISIHLMAYFINVRAPIRLGFLPLPGTSTMEREAMVVDAKGSYKKLSYSDAEEANGLQIALLHHMLVVRYGVDAGKSFFFTIANHFGEIIAMHQQSSMQGGQSSIPELTLSVASCIDIYSRIAKDSSGSLLSKHNEAKAVLQDENGVGRGLVKATSDWIYARGLSLSGGALVNGIILDEFDQQEVTQVVGADFSIFQQAVMSGELDDGVYPSIFHAITGHALRLSTKNRKPIPKGESKGSLKLSGMGNIVFRYNAAIFASVDLQRFLPLSAPSVAPLIKAAGYIHAPNTADDVKSVSITLFDDFSSSAGLSALSSALSYVRADPSKGDEFADRFVEEKYIRAPEALRSEISKLIRVGMVHMPPISSLSIKNGTHEMTVGDLLNTAWSLVTGSLPSVFQSRLDEQAPLLAFVTQMALNEVNAATKSDRHPDLSTITRSVMEINPQVAEALGFRAKVVSKLGELLQQATSESISSSSLDWLNAIASSFSVARDIAHKIVSSSIPEARHVDDSSAVVRIRAIAANGRVLALVPSKTTSLCSHSSDFLSFLGNDEQVISSESAAVSLSSCVSPSEIGSLVQQEHAIRGSLVRAMLSTFDFPSVDPDDLTATYMSGLTMAAASAVGASITIQSGSVGGKMSSRVALKTSSLHANASSFISYPKGASEGEDSMRVHVTAVLDPVSPDAARMAPLLQMLRDRMGAIVHVFLRPPENVTELPLKSYYRFVAPLPVDSSATTHSSHPKATFSWLPSSAILTLKTYVPEVWNTQTSKADVDLDNLRLADVSTPFVRAEYVVKDVIVAGQCVDITSSTGATSYPNGLQLVLSSRFDRSSVVKSDTLVMQNLGYWQLKALPGIWSLRLAEGRAKTLYDVITFVPQGAGNSTSGTRAATGSGGYNFGWGRSQKKEGMMESVAESLDVVLRDFSGTIFQLSVKKKPGTEQISLLDTVEEGEKSEESSIWSSMKESLFGSHKESAPTAVQSEKPLIHVFSLASGHLYERFLKIMMLSATKRSPSSKLKFWLIENFLSPQFKETIPALAETYGFEVGFVTYKWPNWLRQQTEKQRIIWGYKILFLDVLFPLNVTRIIYVDSDQVVRSDLKELWDMDLHGKPYAYTPFCTSREETLGFQFWRSGYWADHLRGKNYHISALYVVDLLAFRRTAVGDQLRAIYDQLSRDPNSLSNLDQDLPNYAQHSVPIHSLPQEWLWCESWCSDESKASAKTIDLCNNPRFKEPKLDMAKRVISGELFPESWIELDNEVRENEEKWLAAKANMKVEMEIKPTM